MKFLLCLVLQCWALTLSLNVIAAVDQSSTVGRERAISVVLANPALQPVPADARAALVVRIASREPVSTGTRYDLRFLGAVPGSYDVTRYLIDVEGRPLSGMAPITVNVRSLLPPGFPGDLVEAERPAAPRLGGYHLVMIGVGIAWLVAVPFLWRRQRRVRVAAPVAIASLAEQLREVIERARTTGLDTEARARLERLLLAHWRERLELHHLDAPAAMQRLRAHCEAGALLRQLDTWLHAPPGRGTVDVTALLAPYSSAPAAAPATEPAAAPATTSTVRP